VKRTIRTPQPVANAPTRERILDAAIAEFAEHGFEHASTRVIAAKARVTQPLINHHFGAKEGLWRAAVDRAFAPLTKLEIPAIDLARPDAVRTAAALWIERFVRVSADNRQILGIVQREGRRPSPRLDYLVDRHLGLPFQFTRAAIAAAQGAGLVRQRHAPEQVLFVILGAVGHVFDVPELARVVFGLDPDDPAVKEQLGRTIASVLLHGLVGG